MAGIIGLAGGGLLMGLALAAFSPGTKNTYTDTYNVYTESLGEVIQRAMSSTSQTANINQTIRADGVDATLCGSVTFSNGILVDATAIGTFDAKSSADIQNAITNAITTDITNDTNVKTAFFGSLPPNTNATDMERNIHQVVRQVYTSENLNSMRQSLQANQIISLHNVKLGGSTCTITNTIGVRLLAQNSLNVLSQALFKNSFTSQFMTSLRNKYVGVAQGIFGPLEGFLQTIAWGIVGVLIIVGLIVGVGLLLKFTQKKPVDTTNPSGGLEQALLLSSLGS